MFKKKKRTRTFGREIINVWINSHSTFTKKKMSEVLEKDVFQDYNFKRHVKEVSLKLSIPEDVVESVIKHYFTFISYEMIRIRNVKRRIVIYGFFYLDVLEPYYDSASKYYWRFVQKHFKGIRLKNLMINNNNKNKNYE